MLYWLGCRLRNQGVVVLFPTWTGVSRPATRPTHPLIEWVVGVHSLELQWPECEAGHLPPPYAGVKNVWGTSSHICMACTWMTFLYVYLFSIICKKTGIPNNVFDADSMTRFSLPWKLSDIQKVYCPVNAEILLFFRWLCTTSLSCFSPDQM